MLTFIDDRRDSFQPKKSLHNLTKSIFISKRGSCVGNFTFWGLCSFVWSLHVSQVLKKASESIKIIITKSIKNHELLSIQRNVHNQDEK